tara:strand:- start:111 stop:659 length:549 start_codon:yes stop_codon:yes gene_type:complete
MAFNIEDFKSNFADGGARPNLFRAKISLPSTLGNLPNQGSYLIKSAQIPSATVTAIDVPYFGRQVRVAGNRTFEPWTVTIMNTEGFEVRNAMEKWMSQINSHNDNGSALKNLIDYKADATVEHLKKIGGPENPDVAASYKFFGMFPTEISSIELGWENNDTIEEFTVTFAYDYWHHDGQVTN